MSFLYFLESIRNPILDAIMSVVTMVGEETIFLAIALLIFWCLDKKRGYIFLLIGFVGIICPHVTKKLMGQDHRVTIPVSALTGSLLLLFADTFSRCMGSGSALPVGATIRVVARSSGGSEAKNSLIK